MTQDISREVGACFDRSTGIFRKLAHSPFINLGFWDTRTRAIATAQRRMVREFGCFCRLARGLDIVDVGCGTGAQDILWMEECNPASIRGVNVSAHQVDLARATARRSRHPRRIAFEVGDACRLPPDLAGIDRVIGLECAHLFSDLPGFFRSAFRCLVPGGTLALANLTYVDARAFEEDILSGLRDALPGVDLEPYRPLMDALPHFEQQHAMLQDDMIRAAEAAGFSRGAIDDISGRVRPFYAPFMKRTRALMRACTDPGDIHTLILFAISFVMRRRQFKDGSLRYLFLEFRK